MSGKLIAASGLDGCGKSHLCDLISKYLDDNAIDHVRSSAISSHSTTISSKIGDILRDPQTDDPLSADAEHALMIAARCMAEANVIKPALDAGLWVVSDRYAICGSIYQRGPDDRYINEGIYQMRLTLFGLTRTPDLEIVLDVDPERPLKPHEPDSNRLENRPMDEWKKMRSLYKQAALVKPYAVEIGAHIPKIDVFDCVKPYLDTLIEESNHEEH